MDYRAFERGWLWGSHDRLNGLWRDEGSLMTTQKGKSGTDLGMRGWESEEEAWTWELAPGSLGKEGSAQLSLEGSVGVRGGVETPQGVGWSAQGRVG